MSSSVRGGAPRGRGRGNGQRGAIRGSSTSRDGALRDSAQRGNIASRGTSGQTSRPNTFRAPRGTSDPSKANASAPHSTTTSTFGGARSKGSWQDRYQALTKARDRERANAIKQGQIADPDKPRSLSEAITPVGTCQEMCAEYERVERVVVKDVWVEERDRNHSVYSAVDQEPDEARMVKKFRRAAAGLEEQLPSDLRPPPVLKRTCDYLFDEVIGGASTLEKVHHFVWDRTRAIRNDFSIQQIAKPEDLSIAIECYERIARFHIVSLHQLAVHPKPYDKYDAQQEREQLDRTLLSLMQYYDDSHGRVHLPNEAEFRAYCVIFQMQDPSPDLEDRVQTWPTHIVQDRRVQTALKVYAAACNTMDPQGPLKPRANHLIAQQDWERFWTLLASKHVSYLMACVAEVYFNLVRRTALSALLRAFKVNPNRVEQDWTLDVLSDMLAFDDHDNIYTFCEAYGFSFGEREDGEQFLDLTSVREKELPQPDMNLPKQWKSKLVESKRFSRALPAVINGLSVRQAQDAGMTLAPELEEEDMEDISSTNGDSAPHRIGPFIEGSSDPADDDSLFVPEDSKQEGANKAGDIFSFQANHTSFSKAGQTPGNGFKFGQPSADGDSNLSSGARVFSPMSTNVTRPATSTVKFDFLSSAAPAQQAKSTAPATVSTPTPTSAPSFSSNLPKFEPGKFSFTPRTTEHTDKAAQPDLFRQIAGDEGLTTSAQEKTTEPEQRNNGGFKAPALGDIGTSMNQKSESSVTAPQLNEAPDHVSAGATLLQTQAETKISQPQFASFSAASSSSSTLPAAPTSPRRASSQDTKPKKPSPLANSFNADGDYTSFTKNSILNNPDSRQLVKTSVPEAQGQATSGLFEIAKTLQQSTVRTDTRAEFASIVRRLADEITSDGHSGFLKQYVDFAVQQMVSSVHAEIEKERMNTKADNFRCVVLTRRYGKRWRDMYWSKRSAMRGHARRERARKALEVNRRSALSEATSDTGRSVDGDFTTHDEDNAALDSGGYGIPNNVSQQFRREKATGSPKPHVGIGSKRPLSSHGLDKSVAGITSGHKRLKSTGHLDDRGRVSKTTPACNSSADLLKRSSFLGFASNKNAAHQGSATRSNYFRLKAMGIEPMDEPGAERSQKRKRLDSVGESSSGLDMSQLFRSRTEHPLQAHPKHTPTPRREPPAISPPSYDPDKALFARLAAARAKLAESTILMKSETAKGVEPQNRVSTALLGESPSMARARAEARGRASTNPSDALRTSPNSEVPAYRLRESRFVPREQHSRAIERAKEIKQSRSRDTSRPESRNDLGIPSANSSPHGFEQHRLQLGGSLGQSLGKATQAPNGLHFGLSQPDPSSLLEGSASPFVTLDHSITQSQIREPELSLQVEPEAPAYSTSNEQPTFGAVYNKNAKAMQHDFTIPQSQVEQSLSNSFNAVNGTGKSLPDQDVSTATMDHQPDSYMHSPACAFQLDEHGHAMPPVQTQPSSFMHSQAASEAMSLLSDKEDDIQPVYANHFAQRSTMNGNEYTEDDAEEDEELLDPSADEEDLGASFGHANPYAALANGDNEETEESVGEDGEGEHYGYDDEGEGEQYRMDGQSEGEQYSIDNDGDAEVLEDEGEATHRGIPRGYQYPVQPEYDEDQFADGDTEDAEDYDGEDFDEDEDDQDATLSVHRRFAYDHDITEGEEEDPKRGPNNWRGNVAESSALQGVGGTVEEAIELSD